MNCKPNQCKRRDNAFGVTWCIKCGKLFTKPCGRELSDEDFKKYNLVKNETIPPSL